MNSERKEKALLTRRKVPIWMTGGGGYGDGKSQFTESLRSEERFSRRSARGGGGGGGGCGGKAVRGRELGERLVQWGIRFARGSAEA